MIPSFFRSTCAHADVHACDDKNMYSCKDAVHTTKQRWDPDIEVQACHHGKKYSSNAEVTH